jgi:hypothetical protein
LHLGRPTELTESDIFLCESFYEESRRQIKKLPRDGLKKYTHSPAVIRDEIYFFRRPIQPQRVKTHSSFIVSFGNEIYKIYLLGILFFNDEVSWG